MHRLDFTASWLAGMDVIARGLGFPGGLGGLALFDPRLSFNRGLLLALDHLFSRLAMVLMVEFSPELEICGEGFP